MTAPTTTLSTTLTSVIDLGTSTQYLSPFTIASTGAIITNGYGVNGTASGVFLENDGRIINTGTGGPGIYMKYDTVVNTGTITGPGAGAQVSGGYLNNAGTAAYIGSPQFGILSKYASTILNSGTIHGGSYGIWAGLSANPNQGSTIVNSGLIYANGASGSTGILLAAGGTVTNAGTITGSGGSAAQDFAVKFAGGVSNRLVVDPGAVFNGAVTFNASTPTNTVELAKGAPGSIGTLSGFGTAITGFNTLAFDASAPWSISGVDTGFEAAQTITGFGRGDSLEITNFAATSSSYIAGTGLVLTNAAHVSETLHINPVTSGALSFTSDGVSTTLFDPTIGTISTSIIQSVTMDAAAYAAQLTITATGAVSAPSSAQYAVYSGALGAYLRNDGDITNAGGVGVGLSNAGAVFNTGSIYGGEFGAVMFGGVLVNYGTATSLGGGGFGVIASNVDIYNAGTIGGGQYGVLAGLQTTLASTIINVGTIYGGSANGGAGIDLGAGGTVYNYGVISGGGGTAQTNVALEFGSANADLLVITPGAAFNGYVVFGSTISNTLELAAGTSGVAGTLTGLGTSINGFTTLAFDDGATWSVSGFDTGETITGFSAGDTFEITGFAAVSESYVTGTGLVLTDSTSHVQILDVNAVVGGSFTYTSDGTNTTIGATGYPIFETIGTTISQGVTMNTPPYDTLLTVTVTDTGAVLAPAGTNGPNSNSTGSYIGADGSYGSTGIYGPGGDRLSNAGSIIGGAGGNGGAGILRFPVVYGPGGVGGQGGDGVALGPASMLSNTGFIAGGAGGAGAYGRQGGGDGGYGGAAVFAYKSSITNSSTGIVLGGAGGMAGAAGSDGTANAGLGGAAITGAHVYLSNAGTIIGGAGGYGASPRSQTAAGVGGAGGDGFDSVYGTLSNAITGSITGGAGGTGGAVQNNQPGVGGAGGLGVDGFLSGSFRNAGTITGGAGGAGGAGGNAFSNGGPFAGTGGLGGGGVYVSGSATLTNTSTGLIQGGAGGHGGLANDSQGRGNGGDGNYGAGVNGAALTNAGNIIGGAGGDPFLYGAGGQGGDGILVGGGVVNNAYTGTLTGGAGGAGGYGGSSFPDLAGTGGAGLYSYGDSTLTNSGYIFGGAGGKGNPNTDTGSGDGGGSGGGTGGEGVYLTTGDNFTNSEMVTGGAGGNGARAQIYGGKGGTGGVGVVANGGVLENDDLITGGAGGNGAGASGGSPTDPNNGPGGTGGDGVVLSNGAVLTNTITIRGGKGGQQDVNSPAAPTGAGGVGVAIYGGTLITSGRIYGGLSGDGVTRADAVYFGTQASTLIIENGALFAGNVMGNANGLDLLEFSGVSTSEFYGFGTKVLNFSNIGFDAGAAWVLGGSAAGFDGDTLTGFSVTNTLDVTGLASGLAGTTLSADAHGVLMLSESGGGNAHVTFTGEAGFSFTLSSDGIGGLDITAIPCFLAGTRIATPQGEVAVETLNIGDAVLTADGRSVPVRWVGVRVVATRFADTYRAMPIRIRAGALGEGLPRRDLLVSPDHAMFLDGILVQAGALVNGSSITREANMPARFTYYHLEAENHELILAEGTATESFIDNADRMGFDNWAEHEALYGGAPAIPELLHPRAKSARQVPLRLHRWLAAAAVKVA
jgi:hypothetical protein